MKRRQLISYDTQFLSLFVTPSVWTERKLFALFSLLVSSRLDSICPLQKTSWIIPFVLVSQLNDSWHTHFVFLFTPHLFRWQRGKEESNSIPSLWIVVNSEWTREREREGCVVNRVSATVHSLLLVLVSVTTSAWWTISFPHDCNASSSLSLSLFSNPHLRNMMFNLQEVILLLAKKNTMDLLYSVNIFLGIEKRTRATFAKSV